MSRLNFLKDGLWFGELLAGSLREGGITRDELAQHWRTSGLEDDRRNFSRDVFRNIRQEAEELYGCVFVCNRRRSNRWTVEGGREEEKRFVEKVMLFRKFMEK